MSTGRNYAVAAVLDGLIFVVGGQDDIGIVLSSVEKYDPKTQRWSKAPAMSTARYFAAAAVADGLRL